MSIPCITLHLFPMHLRFYLLFLYCATHSSHALMNDNNNLQQQQQHRLLPFYFRYFHRKEKIAALMKAAEAGIVADVKACLEKVLFKDVNAKNDESGDTALMIAVQNMMQIINSTDS